MKTSYEVTLKKVDQCKVHIDETIWNEAALQDFSRYFNKVETIEDLLNILMLKIQLQGIGENYEGFGFIKTNTLVKTEAMEMVQLDATYKRLTDNNYCKGIEITVTDESPEYEVELTKVKGGK